jgi:hypothetical protein
MPKELNEKQQEIIVSGEMIITNIKEVDNVFSCSIFGL